MGQRTAGDEVFEAYLRERGIPIPEHEPDLGIGKRPDYLVTLGEDACLCEVKEFAPGTNSIPGSGSWPMTTVLKPIRSKVHEGARQLRPAAELGHPLVVVLTNPHHAPVIDAGETPPAPHESEAWHPNTTPTRWRFDTARQVLHSQVKAMPLDFADCDLGAVGQWDVVLYLGVLYHMPDPVRALRRVAAVTRRQAIIETEAMFLRGHPEALWRFFPAGELNHDRSNWWVPNLNALMGLIGAAGFSNAEIIAGEPTDDEPSGDGPHHYRAIVRAIK